MKSSEIGSFIGFHKAIAKHGSAMLRGVSNASYKLIPKVGRNWKLDVNLLKIIENTILEAFKRSAIRHLKLIPNNKWEWLALGQHYGLPTRLLDWTNNPLVALYFACHSNPNRNGAIYFSFITNLLDETKDTNPFDITEDWVWKPSYLTERFAAQSGLFTVSTNPLQEFTKDVYFKLLVKASKKKEILMDLNRYGIHSGSLFPGLEGVSKYIEEDNAAFFRISDKKSLFKVLEKIKKDREKYFESPPTLAQTQ